MHEIDINQQQLCFRNYTIFLFITIVLTIIQPLRCFSHPEDSNDELYEPNGPLDSLGEILTDDKGRLLVLASSGNAVGQYDEYGVPIQMTGDLNNVGWFDSAADGPVNVTILFNDGSTEEAFGAWVVCGDPAYAPQIRNVVSVWDDVYNMFVRDLELQDDLFLQDRYAEGGNYNPNYEHIFALYI